MTRDHSPTYTSILRRPLETIAFEDEDFIDSLLAVGRLFRPFSEAMDEFILSHGYEGARDDVPGKIAFIRAAFEKADMAPPREIALWYEQGQSIQRTTAFQICFAFGLDGAETDEFFRRVLIGERSFDCHRLDEAVWYFCLNHGFSWAEAEDILERLPEVDERVAVNVYTGSIIADLNGIETIEELEGYLSDNINQFIGGNVTASSAVRRLWDEAVRPDGLLMREYARFAPPQEGESPALRADGRGMRTWDAYLAILQLDRRRVSRLPTDRSIRPILSGLHAAARDAFPDRQGIDMILRGDKVSYERVRKWLVLLTFYTFWASRALERGDYQARERDGERFVALMDQHLIEAGYPELFIGNPYDWIFLYAAADREPLSVFREIFKSLLGKAVQ